MIRFIRELWCFIRYQRYWVRSPEFDGIGWGHYEGWYCKKCDSVHWIGE